MLAESLRRRAEAAAVSVWPGAVVPAISELPGGTSSLTYRCDVEGAGAPAELVLKVAPPGLAPVRNRDVLRQARLLHTLAGVAGVPVPTVYFIEAGDPPLFAMSFIPGECVEPMLADDGTRAGLEPRQVRARALDAAAVLAALHAVEPAGVGLAAEPVVTPRDEIDRWTRALGTVADDLRAGADRAAAALLDGVPPPDSSPAVVHGDFRLGNTLCAGDRVAAVIDWEIWSLGDPRLDVTWLAFFSGDEAHPAAPPSTRPTGMPDSAELLDAYAAASRRPLRDITWFRALTRYKELGATALLVKRRLKAGPLDEMGELMLHSLPVLVEETVALASRAARSARA